MADKLALLIFGDGRREVIESEDDLYGRSPVMVIWLRRPTPKGREAARYGLQYHIGQMRRIEEITQHARRPEFAGDQVEVVTPIRAFFMSAGDGGAPATQEARLQLTAKPCTVGLRWELVV